MIRHLLNTRVAVVGWDEVSDGMGGTIRTEVSRGEYAAKVDLPTADEQVIAAQAGSKHTHNVFFEPSTDVRRGDFLTRGSQKFRVISVIGPSHPVYKKAECELIQSEG